MSCTEQSGTFADILVVDDKSRNRILLEEYLRPEGYSVRMADGGANALDMAMQQPPDLILLDVMMPDINGLEVCARLKNHESTRMTQVMLVTALGGSDAQVQGLDCGADDYVVKPVRREEFLAKVRSLLRAHRLVRELHETREALHQRNVELEELQAMKATLSQSLVHDLKNPLTSMLGNLELLSRDIDEAARVRVTRCRNQASRMHGMILDLLDVAGLEEGRLKLHQEPVEACELIHTTLDGLEGLTVQHKVCLEVRTNGKIPDIYGDRSVLTRVLDNLLVNAMTHSPSGGVIVVSCESRPEGVEIVVTDQGAGIPEEFRDKVFEKFARLELKGQGVNANRGLGLTFSRLAVEAHGGVIWAENAPEGGASFRMILPSVEDMPVSLEEDQTWEQTGTQPRP
jgi:two-component system sensor histidine kinase/response regulator